ncbi:TPA: hypothetical protein ACIVVW_004503, partial [Salmonella enterica subsp. enterica serovar 16:l,v:-]
LDNNGDYSGIVSLTTKKGGLMMMSHYADNHRGGFLEFTISDDIGEGINNRINLFIKNDHIHYHCGPVTYADKDNRGFSYSNNNIDDIYLACFEKGYEWSVEEEIRYVADFRKADYFILPVNNLLDYYVSRIDDVIGYEVENECVSFIYRDFEDNHLKLRARKIQDIFFAIIMSKDEVGTLRLSEDMKTIYFDINKDGENFIIPFMKLNRLVKDNIHFYPMLNVNPDTLTGVYLGARFDRKDLHSEDLYKFKNLGCNIYSCELSDIDFSLEFNKVDF